MPMQITLPQDVEDALRERAGFADIQDQVISKLREAIERDAAIDAVIDQTHPDRNGLPEDLVRAWQQSHERVDFRDGRSVMREVAQKFNLKPHP